MTKLDIQLEISTDGSDDHLIDTVLNSGKTTRLRQNGEDVTRKYSRVKFQSVADMAENTHWPEMQREKQELPAVIESNPPASNTYPHFIQNNVDEIDLSKVFQRIQKQTAPLAEAVQRIQKQTAPLAEAAQRIQKQTLPIVEAVQRIQKQTSPIVEAVQRIQAQQAYFDNTVRALQKKLAIQNRMLQELSTPRNVFGNNAEHVLGGFGSLLGNHSHTHSSIFGNHSHNQVLGNLGNSNKKEY